MKKIVIVCGLISGAIISTTMGIGMYMCTKNPTNYEHSMFVGYASMLLCFSLIFVGIKIYRDKHNGGIITFGKAFKMGILMALIASAIYVATWAVEYNTFASGFMENYTAHMISKAKASGMSQEKINAQIAQMDWYKKNYSNPVFFTLLTMAEIFPVGLIVSLISALILKKKNKPQTVAG